MYLGLDGGGSKTRGVILSKEGRVAAAAKSGGTAFVGPPPPEVRSMVRALRDDLLRKAGASIKDVDYCVAGMNGVDFADELEEQKRGIGEALGLEAGKLALVNDAIVALWGASSSPAAVLLQHGSGITSALRPDYGQERLFDHLDSGKLFDIRHEAIKLVARMIDGRAAVSGLKRDVLEHAGIRDENEYSEAVFRGRIDWRLRAGLAEVVYRAYERGDPGAKDLIDRALADYALSAKAMVDKTGSDSAEIIFSGGVIDNMPDELWGKLVSAGRACCPASTVRRPMLAPEVGAGLMAAFRAGNDPAAFYRKVVQARPA